MKTMNNDDINVEREGKLNYKQANFIFSPNVETNAHKMNYYSPVGVTFL